PDFHTDDCWTYNKLEIAYRVKRFIEQEIRRSLKDKLSFQPSLFEARFGYDDGAPALVLNGNAGPITLRGKIDRIDVGIENQARIIDYKSGSGSISFDEAKDGRNLQLPVYMLAVEQSVLPGVRV